MNENESPITHLADHPVAPASELLSQDSDDPLERIPDAVRVDFHHGLAGQRCLKSRLHFEAGDVLAGFFAKRHSRTPHRMTVQTGESSHIELGPTCIELVNHSCDPNVFFDVVRFELVALRTIEPGDELTFFYPSTEWRMESPFRCECGSPRCLGLIDGAGRMGRDKLAGHRLSAHIHALLDAHERERREEHAFEIGLLPASLLPGFAF